MRTNFTKHLFSTTNNSKTTSSSIFLESENQQYAILSGLYFPGHVEKMFAKSTGTKAQLLVPDLEDAVSYEEKPKARALIKSKLQFLRSNSTPGRVITPRVNGVWTKQLFLDDIKGVIDKESIQFIDGICVPKVDTVEDMKFIEHVLEEEEKKYGVKVGSLKLIPQFESTKSIVFMKDIFEFDISSKKRIIAAAFGADDYTADFEVFRPDHGEDRNELDFARKHLALQCHAFGIVSLDTPFVNFKNGEGLRKEVQYLKSIGIKGKMAIHPNQVDIINEEFSPKKEEVEYYERLVKVFEEEAIQKGTGVCSFENKMIDIAAYRRAKNVIKRSKLIQ